ncbi:exodeoxyribonuclease III [Pelagibacterales bacterium SAG-MED38]|nr:exodeoxyribonuclease III [Pelagibacterales bacterium SAG-MED38]
MIISSWNVNSVRARIKNIKSYLLKYKPDILMIQEIKTEDVNFPYDDFSSMDYESHVFGQKSYNGVAIISKRKLKNIKTDLIKDKLKQSRIISAELEHKKKNIQLINIYTPNGNPVDTEKYDYKKKWLDDLIKQLKALTKKNQNIILGGDFNIIPAAEDVYNPKSFEDDALFKLEIRKKLREMINLGFNDVYRHFNETKEGYTFWDYMRGAWQKNNGMRIDHFLVSNSLIDQVKSININKDPRDREKPSDHTPIEITLA